ncbi:shikimate dehydrogenase [Planktothricoides sp. SR001]|uniref:shikimate dehydrogenase n=1 Tax=Planktothricoides sp. SR001 TaxID=1705388 RepID=UPI0006C67755|nr:shikimate dehydrogenase [Planktothricoides sp. SR001]KOR36898.1 shikimate dehydrogenase [Planktothricoides sp. SR001]
MQIKGTTKLLGVMGDPVEHSLSPAMHNAAIAHLGIDYVYLPFPVKPAKLATAVAGLAAIGVKGFNLTIPHKQAIIPLLSEVSPLAQSVGAVNTVCWTEQGWVGTNTDVAGFLAPLRSLNQSLNRDWKHTKVVILGAGGAARAVVAGCRELGCTEILMVGRNRDKLAAFAESWLNTPISVPLTVHPWEELSMVLPETGLLVNTTPIGMYPQVERSPLSDADFTCLNSQTIVYDLIYTPSPTQFLQQAKAVGAIAIDGSEMLVQQGAAALKIWIEQPVPVEVMRQALHQKLGLAT